MTRAQGAIAHMIIIVTCCSQGIKGASVEGLVRGNNFIFGGRFSHAIFAGQLHGTLITLCTAVSKENAIHTSGFGHKAQSLCLNFGVIQIGAMHNLGSLVSNRLYQHRMVIPQGVYRNASKSINIFMAFVVPHTAALAMVHNHLVTPKDGQIIFFCLFNNSLFIHL